MIRTILFKMNGKWPKNPLRAELIGQAGIYTIRHEPTGCRYTGGTHDMAQAYYAWYQRLRHFNAQPALNPAFRAVYTCREDFVFIVKEMEPCDESNHHRFKTKARKEATKFKSESRHKCLNVGDAANGKCSVLERAYWRDRTPVNQLPNTDIAYRPKYVIQDQGEEIPSAREARFKHPVQSMCIDDCGMDTMRFGGHYYMVRSDLWNRAFGVPADAPAPTGMLCRNCLQKRLLPHILCREDFPEEIPINNGFNRNMYPARSSDSEHLSVPVQATLTPEQLEQEIAKALQILAAAE